MLGTYGAADDAPAGTDTKAFYGRWLQRQLEKPDVMVLAAEQEEAIVISCVEKLSPLRAKILTKKSTNETPKAWTYFSER